MDSAVEEYKAATPEPDPELDWEFQETGEFGQDGWTISYTHKSVKKDDWSISSTRNDNTTFIYKHI